MKTARSDSHLINSSLSNYLKNAMKTSVLKDYNPMQDLPKKTSFNKVQNYECKTARNNVDINKNKNKITNTKRNFKNIKNEKWKPINKLNYGSQTPILKTCDPKQRNGNSHYRAETKWSKGKLGKIIKTISNDEDWSNSLRTNFNKRYGTPNGQVKPELRVFGASSSWGEGLTPKNNKFTASVAKDLKELFHTEEIMHNNPDFKTLFDSDSHDFSFSKDEVNPNQTKVKFLYLSF